MTTRSTLALRAARYFGLETKPRMGILVDGNRGYLMVAKVGDRTLLAHYSEEFRPTGDFIKLTPKQREALIDALRDDWEEAP